MVINQGDVYWIDFGDPSGSNLGFLRPAVVIQNNVFNQSRINTVVVCALTSNLQRANAPGNVLLEDDEANLPKQSVINISQLFTVDKLDLVEKIGSLPSKRIRQIVSGINLLIEPRNIET
jgi:mRNA interferase MazF